VIDWDSTGPDDAPALVLGPSLGTRRSFFDRSREAFGDRWRVIRFDLPGHGTSPRPFSAFELSDVADAVIDVVDGLGISTFSYVGVSISGAIGQSLAIRYPDRIDALVLCSTAAYWPDQEQWRGRADAVRHSGVGFMVPSRAGAWFSPGFERADEAAAEGILRDLAATDPESYALCCDAIRRFDARPSLARIAAPTLIITGEQDPATPPSLARQLHDGIPGSRLETIEGGYHLLQLEHAALVTTLITAHLEKAAALSEGTS
jgi:3-oxoadipate enol-lactonase